MPTYTYRCKNCGKSQDEFHSMSAKPRVKCNVCGAACKRMIGTGSGVIFKGSGFYETDYKTRTGMPAKSEAGSESKSDAKPDTKTQTKSDTPKTESKPKKSDKAAASSTSSE